MLALNNMSLRKKSAPVTEEGGSSDVFALTNDSWTGNQPRFTDDYY